MLYHRHNSDFVETVRYVVKMGLYVSEQQI